jgi:hypothetical protein
MSSGLNTVLKLLAKDIIRRSQYWGHPITVRKNMYILPHQLGRKKNLIGHLKNDHPYALIKCKSVRCHQIKWEDKALALTEDGGYYVALTDCKACEHHKEGCCILDQERISERNAQIRKRFEEENNLK